MTVDPTERRRTPLALKLTALIRSAGPISVRDYMEACLQDAEHGYYRTRAGIGRDFTTAPEISQIFGELIGLWCAVVWRQMESPETIDLVELGPGRGTMMRDMLRALRAAPGLLAAARVRLVESSAALRTLQRKLLADASVPMSWHDAWSDPLPGPAIVIANEFLDALPAEQYIRTATGWRRRLVGLDARGLLQFTADATADDTPTRLLHQRFADANPGDIVEVHTGQHPLIAWMRALTESHSMAALFIDYGYDRSAAGETLQAVRAQRYEHPLCSPGEADLTVHVDFEAMSGLLGTSSALEIEGPVTQAEFLGRLGLVERASRLMASSPGKAHEIEAGAQRLMSPGGMGTRFKALGARSRHMPPLPGLGRSGFDRANREGSAA